MSPNQLSLPLEPSTNLEELDLSSHNQLTSLPDALWRLNNLRQLNLAENRLTSIPEEIGSLACLQTLDLGHINYSAGRSRSTCGTGWPTRRGRATST